MTTLLVLNHRGNSLSDLVGYLRGTGVGFEMVEPPMRRGSAEDEPGRYDGVIASGGALDARGHRQTLAWYSGFLDRLDVPFLGICLGMRILAYCHHARIRRIPRVQGYERVRFFRDFPLAPGCSEMNVYQNHQYEVIPPLPDDLENFAGDGSPVQAIRVRGREQFAVQFHPEVGSTGARVVLDSFVRICASGAPGGR